MILILQVISLILQLIAQGLSDTEAVNTAARQFGLDPDKVRKYL
ncbi:hypothetical protein [Turicibacter sanguinis]|nr:hypothetical protein [Turicibacter sanguinis]